MFDNQLRF